MLVPKCGGGFHIKLLYFVSFRRIDVVQAVCAPIAKQPEIIVVSKFFYLFLVVCHIGVEQMRLECQVYLEMLLGNDVGQQTVGRMQGTLRSYSDGAI